MKALQLCTAGYRHECYFVFDGKYYLVNSYVELTEYGKKYLESDYDKVQLTKHFFMPKNGEEIECWGFVVAYRGIPPYPYVRSTDEPLEKLIKEVVVPAKYEPPNKKPEPVKVINKDWKVPDVRNGWILFAIFFFGVEILKDWYLKFILRIVVGWYFGLWRQRRMIEEGYVDFGTKMKSKDSKKQIDEIDEKR